MIFPYQPAFIERRLIQENSIVAYKALHSIRKKQGKGGSMAYKADMEKVFDKMEWSLILIALENYGFPAKFINWIYVCLSIALFSILLNRSPIELFHFTRGLWQGDHSP